jgi:hypothetical protein
VPSKSEAPPPRTELLYPFYLDTDMSMAFAATLAGGVALESEQLARVEEASSAVRSLRGSLGLFGAGGLDGGGARSGTSGRTDESTLVRRHTMHSIFIDLHDELRSSGRLLVHPTIDELEVGALLSMSLRPAIAPLRRVIDQVLRLLDVMSPIVGPLGEDEPPPVSRQDRRKQARDAARAASAQTEDESGVAALRALRSLFVALRDDLEHSGMIDVVVDAADGDGPSVVLTLDKRFADQTALELIHTSSFTVVGKVTQLWPTEEDAVLLYRRSVLSLLPGLSQQVAVGVFTFLIGMAKAIGVVDVDQEVRSALGTADAPSDELVAEQSPAAGKSETAVATETGEPSDTPDTAPTDDDIRVGEDIAALNPVLSGPAIQILPLALCV